VRVFAVLLAAGAALAQGPVYTPVASTGQIMQAMIQPAVGAVQAAAKDTGPADDRAWRTVLNNAIVMEESAQLLLIGNRAKDNDGWVKAVAAFQEAGAGLQKAAAAKDLPALQTAAGAINGTCQGCHSVYRMRPGQKKQ
jgi:cytochrome c556